MNSQGSPTLSEVKVGAFVVVVLIILAAAIFTIGTEVGLLEKTFYAKTYLNNVSGLKPGDVVLMAGVEVGNVIDVRISGVGALPQTSSNRSNLARIQDLRNEIADLEKRLPQTRARLKQANARYDEALKKGVPRSREVRRLEREKNSLEELLQGQQRHLQDDREKLIEARNNLQNIVVLMEIQSKYRDWIKRDSNISLGSIGLLGDKYIEISLGRSKEEPKTDKETVTTWLGKETRDFILITGTTQPGFQELVTGADDVLANLKVLSDKLSSIMSRLAEGEGTVGKFLNDPAFYNNLNQTVVEARGTVERASALMQDIHGGQGTIGRLVQERVVYDRISSATERLEEVLARIEKGEGALGKFINDSSVYDKADDLMAQARSIAERMNSGKGTLGKLSTDDQLYENLRKSLDQFTTLVRDIKQGKGTLGRLAQDERLYQNLNDLSSEMVKLIYDIRQNPKKFLTINLKIF